MSAVRAKNTAPELIVRRALFAKGFRYRLHVRDLPGTPDILLPSWRVAIFVHGCFWHGHDCSRFRWPSSNAAFWAQKIATNRKNDAKAREALTRLGWRVSVVWECDVR